MRGPSLHSRRKLKPADAARFAHAGPPLFVALAEVVCATGVLPQKELHECWQMALCVHQEFPACARVADLAAGHGLLAWILVLLARTAPAPLARTAVAVDIRRPKSAAILGAALARRWPELAGAVHYVEGSVDCVGAGGGAQTLFVAAHACGSLSDRVLLAAVTSGNPLAIMPCCHSARKQAASLAALADVAGLDAAAGDARAIDRFRIAVLTALRYDVSEAMIEPEITAFNRIIIGKPAPGCHKFGDLTSPRMPRKRSGEIRAFESVASINAADAAEAQALSERPSREWRRFFDLSYWVRDEASGETLLATLRQASAGKAYESVVTIHDRYTEPTTRRLAFTYRIELRSCRAEIARSAANLLRDELRGVDGPFELRGG